MGFVHPAEVQRPCFVRADQCRRTDYTTQLLDCKRRITVRYNSQWDSDDLMVKSDENWSEISSVVTEDYWVIGNNT